MNKDDLSQLFGLLKRLEQTPQDLALVGAVLQVKFNPQRGRGPSLFSAVKGSHAFFKMIEARTVPSLGLSLVLSERLPLSAVLYFYGKEGELISDTQCEGPAPVLRQYNRGPVQILFEIAEIDTSQVAAIHIHWQSKKNHN